MSRSQSRDNSTDVSLFPFLAVLLCTMGGLVVLLVAMSHATRQMAEREREETSPPSAPVEQDDQAAERLAQINKQIAQLKNLEQQAAEQLRDEQLRIAQIESHVRKLQEELAALAVTKRELDADADSHYDDRAQAERELSRLEQLIADSESEVEALKKQQDKQSKSYAIVPYKGKHGTHRRPIYIECLADKAILQPEGIVFTQEDLAGPYGPANPIASALRAIQARMTPSTSNDAGAVGGSPYPLILVRPGGIVTHNKVRAAISSWDTDFGFQVVADDWEIEYPNPPDPSLAQSVNAAIENSRISRAALASAAPSAFRSTAPIYNDIPRGANGPAGRQRSKERHNGSSAWGTEEGEDGGENFSVIAQKGRNFGPPNRGDGRGKHGHEDHQEPGIVGRDSANGQVGLDTTKESGNGDQDSGQLHGTVAQSNVGTASNPGSQSNGANSPQSGNTIGSGASAGGNSSDGFASRLRPKKRTDVAIRRSVKVSVYADRVVLGNGAVEVPMVALNRESVGGFVEALQRQIMSWGMAGDGLYWRPIIQMDARPGGASHSRTLEKILVRSGIDVTPVETAGNHNKEPERATR